MNAKQMRKAGGRARAGKLTPEECSAISRKGGKARWDGVEAARRSEIMRAAVVKRWDAVRKRVSKAKKGGGRA